MTTLYRPVLITSAEQAESLPHGTWARSDVGGGIPEETVVRTADERQPWRNGPAAWSSSELVGWLALVPVEAEDEWDVVGYAAVGHRYVTPWEEV